MGSGYSPTRTQAIHWGEARSGMTIGAGDSTLLGRLFARPELAKIFSDRARLQGLLDFEAALARAQAGCGVIPEDAAGKIAEKCRAELFDLDALGAATAKVGNPVIPMVKKLTALVGGKAGRYVHWGATSQDVMDTALVTQLGEVLDHTQASLDGLIAALAALARKHRDHPMAGRTFMQQALPISFGFKVTGWLSALLRARERLGELRPRLAVVQFGGAVGTLAALAGQGRAVQKALAAELKLGVPDMPWQSARDRFAELAAQFALLCGTLAKMAGDVALLMQSEIAEVSEPVEFGRGGSSTMPHKRNPVAAAAILAACEQVQALAPLMLRALGQDHERGTGGWHAEWLALPEIVVYGASALAAARALAEGLVVDPERMRANLDLTHGLIMAEAVAMALAAKLGRLAAHEKVGEACAKAVAEKRHLSAVIAENAEITDAIGAAALKRLFDPAGYLGEAGAFVDAVTRAADKALKRRDK